jgi:hypothetical protein
VVSNKAAQQAKKQREEDLANMMKQGLDDEPMGNLDFIRQPNAF